MISFSLSIVYSGKHFSMRSIMIDADVEAHGDAHSSVAIFLSSEKIILVPNCNLPHSSLPVFMICTRYHASCICRSLLFASGTNLCKLLIRSLFVWVTSFIRYFISDIFLLPWLEQQFERVQCLIWMNHFTWIKEYELLDQWRALIKISYFILFHQIFSKKM